MDQLFDLKERVAVVNGGTGLLGSAITRGLSGAHVGVLERRLRRAEEVALGISEESGRATALTRTYSTGSSWSPRGTPCWSGGAALIFW